MNAVTIQSRGESCTTAVVCCAVLEDEVRVFAKEFPQIAAVRMLPQGLHNTPPKLRESAQQIINDLEKTTSVDAIVLVYGLCSRGTEGLVTTRAKLVIPRAHDCITLLLGSRQRYADYVHKNPGTYWYSPGWNRHHVPPGHERYSKALQDYRSRFSEDDAQYLMQTEQAWYSQYNRATFVDLAVCDTTHDVNYTRQCAHWLGWSFDRQQGDPTLLKDLLAGPWDKDRFLVLEPGQTFKMTADERIVDRITPVEDVTVHGRPITPRTAQ